jgi:hypothetical protein
MSTVTAQEAYDEIQQMKNNFIVTALVHCAAGATLAHAQQYGIAGLWFKQAAKFGATGVGLDYVMNRCFFTDDDRRNYDWPGVIG